MSGRHVLVVGGAVHRLLGGHHEAIRRTLITNTSIVPRLTVETASQFSEIVALHPSEGLTQWLEVSADIDERHAVSRIAVLGETDQLAAAHIANRLGLPYQALETVRNVVDKVAMRESLSRHGDNTRFHRVHTVADVSQVISGAPRVSWILKPAMGTGSAGISKIADISDVDRAWARAKQARFFRTFGDESLILEEYVDGEQYSVEAISAEGCHNIVAIVRKFSDPDSFVEIGHCFPSGLSAEDELEISDYVSRALQYLGVKNGVTHTELIVGKAGPHLIETHLRPAGDRIPQLVRDVTGVDLEQIDLEGQLTGNWRYAPAHESVQLVPASATWFIGSKQSGVVGAIDVPKETGVGRAEVLKGVGSMVNKLAHSKDRIVQTFAVGDSPEDALGVAKAIARACVVQLRIVSDESDVL